MILTSPDKFEIVTFDCYGTLIDWETGIRNAFRRASGGRSAAIDQTRVFELYEEEERRIEKEPPYRRYRDVLSLTALAVSKKTEWRFSQAQSHFLAEELPHWTPFPDTNQALERLAKRFKLGILSNVDDDLLRGTLKHFTVPFDMTITAERVKSYKPGLAHFQEARRIIGDESKWMHAAASQYHDIVPAVSLGIRTVWVNRKNTPRQDPRSQGSIKQVKDLTELASWLGV